MLQVAMKQNHTSCTLHDWMTHAYHSRGKLEHIHGQHRNSIQRQPMRLPEPHHQQQPPCCCVPDRDVLERPYTGCKRTRSDPLGLAPSNVEIASTSTCQPRGLLICEINMTSNHRAGETYYVKAKWRMPQPQQGPLLRVANPHRDTSTPTSLTCLTKLRNTCQLAAHRSSLAPTRAPLQACVGTTLTIIQTRLNYNYPRSILRQLSWKPCRTCTS